MITKINQLVSEEAGLFAKILRRFDCAIWCESGNSSWHRKQWITRFLWKNNFNNTKLHTSWHFCTTYQKSNSYISCLMCSFLHQNTDMQCQVFCNTNIHNHSRFNIILIVKFSQPSFPQVSSELKNFIFVYDQKTCWVQRYSRFYCFAKKY